MSITKTMVAKSARDAPSVSTVMFPGQSHISNGIMVLSVVFSVRAAGVRDRCALNKMLYDAHGRLEIESLFEREIIEKDLE